MSNNKNDFNEKELNEWEEWAKEWIEKQDEDEDEDEDEE